MNIDSSQGRAYAQDYERERTLFVTKDDLEDKGREFWWYNRQRMGKWDHKIDDWAFYPLKHGDRKGVETHGEKGIHYAVGYHELGEMVEKYGIIIQNWPDLATSSDDAHDDEVEVEVVSVHVEDVQPPQSPAVASVQNPKPKTALTKIQDIEMNLGISLDVGAQNFSIKERLCKAEEEYFGKTQEGALRPRIDNIAEELGIVF